MNIEEVMNNFPELNDSGMGLVRWNKNETNDERIKKLADERKMLIEKKESFEKTVSWLSNIDKIKSINKVHSSYGLKHIAEKQIGYITNGVFIAAAISCGFEFKPIAEDSINVHFNMSEKSIKKILKDIKEYN